LIAPSVDTVGSAVAGTGAVWADPDWQAMAIDTKRILGKKEVVFICSSFDVMSVGRGNMKFLMNRADVGAARVPEEAEARKTCVPTDKAALFPYAEGEKKKRGGARTSPSTPTQLLTTSSRTETARK